MGVLVGLAGPAPAHAVELGDGLLSLNGYGRWAYGNTLSTKNEYVFAAPGGHYDSGQFALSLTARPIDKLVVGAQVDVDPDATGVSLDWAFVEYRVSDSLRVHGGRFKHAFGIFGETLKVGTLDPFLYLPKSIYGSTEFIVTGVEGIGVTGAVYRGNWSFSYDVYFGSLENVPDPLLAAGLKTLGAVSAGQDFVDEAPDTLGARLIIGTPLEGLDFRLSGYYSLKKTQFRGKRLVFGPSISYVGDRFSARLELFRHEDGEGADAVDLDTDAGYLELAYFLTEHLQVAGRGELSHSSVSSHGVAAGLPSNLIRHNEAAVALNWWFTPAIVAKLSGHYIHGNRYALPGDAAAALAGTGQALEANTTAVMTGVQFSF